MTLFRRLRSALGLDRPAPRDEQAKPRDAGGGSRPASADSPGAVALGQAQACFTNGDFAQASDVAAEGLRALPDAEPREPAVDALASALHAVRGGSAVHRGRLDEAARHFERSLERARASGKTDAIGAARLNLVDASTRRGGFPSEDPELEEAVLSATGTPYEDVAAKLLVERGVALLARGDLQPAIATFDRVLALRPAWPFPLYQRGWARFLQGDPGGALDDYREVGRSHPVFFTVQREIRCLEDVASARLPIEAYRTFCLVRGRVANSPDAVRDSTERMVEKYPDFAPGWVLLAESRVALGRHEEARSAAREALRHDPDPDTAVAALFAEWTLANLAGDADAAREAAGRIHSAYPGYPACEVIRRLGDSPEPGRGVQWTWALDGTLRIQELRRTSDPPPEAPGRPTA